MGDQKNAYRHIFGKQQTVLGICVVMGSIEILGWPSRAVTEGLKGIVKSIMLMMYLLVSDRVKLV